MAHSDVVETKYRIHADDLQGQPREWVIANISYQGLEEMAPVLHIQGLAKRFVLDPEQSRQMTSLTHTPMPDAWVGATIRVAPIAAKDEAAILITSADLPNQRRIYSFRTLASAGTGRLIATVFLLAVLIALAFALAGIAPPA